MNNELLSEIAEQLKENGMQCNCDLDNWAPEPETGHSWMCRIHKQACYIKRFIEEQKETKCVK